MHKLMTILAAVLMTMSLNAQPNDYVLASPDGKLQVMVETGDGIHYSLVHDGDLLVGRSEIGMYMTDGSKFGGLEQVKKASTRGVDQTIKAILYKKAEVVDKFNELTLKFKEFSLVFRAYDDGMAYRFVSHKEEPYNVDHETAEFNFAKDWNMWAEYVAQHTESLESQYYNSFENTYSYTPLSSWNKERLAFLPLMVEGPRGKKVVVTESDLIDYPGMYLYNEKGDKNLSARFAPYPNEVRQGGHNNLQLEVKSRQPYIAKCVGNEKFPWRIIAVSEDDVQKADNDMVYRLARTGTSPEWTSSQASTPRLTSTTLTLHLPMASSMLSLTRDGRSTVRPTSFR